MRFSALIHYFENKYNSHEIQVTTPFEVSQAIMRKISIMCRKLFQFLKKENLVTKDTIIR